MVFFGVKCLFTPIPVDLQALTIAIKRIQQDKNLREQTNMSVGDLMEFSDFVFNHSYFKYDDINSDWLSY